MPRPNAPTSARKQARTSAASKHANKSSPQGAPRPGKPSASKTSPAAKHGKTSAPAKAAKTPVHAHKKAAPAPAAAPAAPLPPKKPRKLQPIAGLNRSSIVLDGPFRAGFVALVGRPNVGKSTLLNALLGEKLAAASPRPQTTRQQFRGILTVSGAQVILVDTPGLFDASVVEDSGKGGFGELGVYMARETRSALKDVDVVVWVEEAHMDEAHPVPTPVQTAIADLLRRSGKPVLLALNKVDSVPKHTLLAMLDAWNKVLPFKAMVPLSALRVDGLEFLVQEAAKCLPESPPLFAEGDLTDATERDIAAELIREKVMMRTGEEVPYAVAVEVERFDESRRDQEGPKGGVIEIDAAIHVERDGQKAIVVGAGGSKVKEIGTLARQDLERFLGARVMLRLFVKVSEHWTRTPKGLRSRGYVPKDA